jgi:hypothetical protein
VQRMRSATTHRLFLGRAGPGLAGSTWPGVGVVVDGGWWGRVGGCVFCVLGWLWVGVWGSVRGASCLLA